MRRLIPGARLTIVDSNHAHLEAARARPGIGDLECIHARFPSLTPAGDYDLVVLPLSFEGDRDALYATPPARLLVVHDWLWRKRGVSRVVSFLLLKRVNLVGQAFE